MKLNFNQKAIMANGGWWGLFDGLTSGFLIAYALALGASNTIVGLMGAIPYIALILSEIPGAKLLEHYTRVRIYSVAATLGRGGWASIILLPLLFPTHPLLVVLLAYFFCKFLEYLTDPAWTVLVADVVDNRIRGSFVAKRIRLISIAGMIALLAGGWYLDLFAPTDLRGFVTLFAAGIIFGLASTYVIARVKEPAYRDHTHHGFKEFFKIEGNFGKYTIFVFCFNFAFMLASPLFTAYILNDLGQTYFIYAVSTALSSVCKILVYPHIGKLSDKYGDKPILLLSVASTALVPLLFLFVTPGRIWLLWPAQMLSGIAWAGYDVAIFNMFLNLTDPGKRAVQTATYNLITNPPLIIAPIIGGYIADNWSFALVGIPLVFAISCVLRFASSLLLIRIPELRAKHTYQLSEVLLHAIEIHPSRGLQNRWLGIVKNTARKGMLFVGLVK